MLGKCLTKMIMQLLSFCFGVAAASLSSATQKYNLLFCRVKTCLESGLFRIRATLASESKS